MVAEVCRLEGKVSALRFSPERSASAELRLLPEVSEAGLFELQSQHFTKAVYSQGNASLTMQVSTLSRLTVPSAMQRVLAELCLTLAQCRPAWTRSTRRLSLSRCVLFGRLCSPPRALAAQIMRQGLFSVKGGLSCRLMRCRTPGLCIAAMCLPL